MAWRRRNESRSETIRVDWIRRGFVVLMLLVTVKLFHLQVIRASYFRQVAEDQHELSSQLEPKRGQILVHDRQSDTGTYPLAANRTLHLMYAIPAQIEDPGRVAIELKPFVTLDQETLLQRLSKKGDLYEPLQHAMSDAAMERVKALNLPGVAFLDEDQRFYPERNIGSHVLGFVGFEGDQKVGRYGIEAAEQNRLAGQRGSIRAEKDAGGRIIVSAAESWQPAVNGTDILLTIDRTVEYETCQKLDAAVQRHGADGGSIIILNPKTGAVIAMCGAPDFDPNAYQDVGDVQRFLNPSTQVTYEPGSVFKALTMAAAVNEGKVTPETTYVDSGEVKIGSYTIRNSDNKAHGRQTMTQVLEESLNTGAIFAMRQIGPDSFYEYVKNFGFGLPTRVGISEANGNIRALGTKKEIYALTGSFGQGITVSPLQLASAYAAIANGGKLMRPYLIEEVRSPSGAVEKTEPVVVRQVVSEKTAATISGMLVNVVKNGHGKRAGVPGYFVAGKTGTAQVPDPKSGGYLKNVTIGTFAGFAPVEDPKFVMVVKIDRPRDVQFAESSAAPLFGEIAKFLLSYYHVTPSDTKAMQ